MGIGKSKAVGNISERGGMIVMHKKMLPWLVTFSLAAGMSLQAVGEEAAEIDVSMMDASLDAGGDDGGSSAEEQQLQEEAQLVQEMEAVEREAEEQVKELEVIDEVLNDETMLEEEELISEKTLESESEIKVSSQVVYHDLVQTETQTLAAGAGGAATVSDGGLGELYIAVHGYPVGDLSKNEKKIYQFLRNKLGLNKAAASGVLANMYFESSFSTVAIGDGGTSLGLCQWHAGRCRSLMGWCNAHSMDYRSLDGQLNYLKYELENGYYNVLGYLYGVPDTADGAYHAGYYFCMYFESPDSVQTRSDARGTYAKSTYYPSDLDKYLVSTDGSAVTNTGASSGSSAAGKTGTQTTPVQEEKTVSKIKASDGSVISISTKTSVVGEDVPADSVADSGVTKPTGSALTETGTGTAGGSETAVGTGTAGGPETAAEQGLQAARRRKPRQKQKPKHAKPEGISGSNE